MKNITLIIFAALTGIILFMFLLRGCDEKKHAKEVKLLNQMISDCVNAPVKLDTLVIRTVLTDTVYLTYRYKVTDTVKVSDAVDWIDQSIERRMYTGKYVHPQFELDWSADVTGTLNGMTLNPPTLIKSLIITKEKTVDLTKYQECPKAERSHLYFTAGTIFTTKEVEGIDMSLAYIHKKGFGVSAGFGTDFEQLNYNAKLIIRLK